MYTEFDEPVQQRVLSTTSPPSFASTFFVILRVFGIQVEEESILSEKEENEHLGDLIRDLRQESTGIDSGEIFAYL